jgi:ABC-2 type transport system ATP-binding protein
MDNPIVQARNLTVVRGEKTILKDVNFSVMQGEVLALLGGNGAGKSTTLLTFLGLLKAASGEACIFGLPVELHAVEARSKIAYLPESATLYGHLSARENIQYFLSLSGIKRTAIDIEAALDRVTLKAEARDAKLESYSKGMRQKTAIALALLREAPVLLLDEPTSGLDPVAIDEFNALVSDLAQSGKTILMVTHDVYGACQVADRIVLMRHGELVGGFTAPTGGMINTEEVHVAFSNGGSA